MRGNLTEIPGSGDDLRGAIEALKRALPVMTEAAHQIAAARKASFDAHVAAGFSEPQALELCKSLTI